jgi:tRNA(Arg) A34 adenosine deaminase TadA
MTDASAEAFAAQQKLFGTLMKTSRAGLCSSAGNRFTHAQPARRGQTAAIAKAESDAGSRCLKKPVTCSAKACPICCNWAISEAIDVVAADAPRPQNAVSTALPDVEVFLPLEGLIDVDRERARLQKELNR